MYKVNIHIDGWVFLKGMGVADDDSEGNMNYFVFIRFEDTCNMYVTWQVWRERLEVDILDWSFVKRLSVCVWEGGGG